LFVQQRGYNPNSLGNGYLWFNEIEPQQAAVRAPGICAGCTPGTFKDTLGSAACTNCPANYYSGLTARTSNATCTKCYENSVADPGSDAIDDCNCAAGYEFS
jgi:hypothetical protein